MDSRAFDALVHEVSSWWIQDLPDWIRLMDSDRLRDLRTATEKRKWLRKAKVEAIRKTVQERVDEIAEAWGSDDDLSVQVLSEALSEDLKNFRGHLSASQQKMWLDRAAMAACGKVNEIGSRTSVVYFVSGSNDRVKIGHTTNLKSRVRTLRTAHPDKLEIRLVLPGTREDEQELHRRFSDQHINGEWFRLDEVILDFIQTKRIKTD